MAWATLQLSWTIVLLASQLWQLSRQMTTLEVSNLGRYGFMGGRGGVSMAGQMGHGHQHSEQSEAAAGHKHSHAGCCGSGFLMQLLGFDRFTKGKAADGLARSTTAPNPFDLGCVGNCKDFWTRGKELGVEYETLYDVPKEGFVEAKRRKEIEEEDDDHSIGSARKSPGASGGFLRKGLSMVGRGGSSRAGYEPVSQA